MLRRVAVRAAVFVLCAACAGPMRPAVIPKLSELPSEPERRNAILDSSHAEPGPENRPTPKKARKAETAAATAAAVIGVLFSNHANVTLGGAAPIDENELFEDTKKRKPKDGEQGDGKDKDIPPPEQRKAQPRPPKRKPPEASFQQQQTRLSQRAAQQRKAQVGVEQRAAMQQQTARAQAQRQTVMQQQAVQRQAVMQQRAIRSQAAQRQAAIQQQAARAQAAQRQAVKQQQGFRGQAAQRQATSPSMQRAPGYIGPPVRQDAQRKAEKAQSKPPQ